MPGRGHRLAQIALAWLLHQPDVNLPIVGASKRQHLADMLVALNIRLDGPDLRYLEELYQPHPVLG